MEQRHVDEVSLSRVHHVVPRALWARELLAGRLYVSDETKMVGNASHTNRWHSWRWVLSIAGLQASRHLTLIHQLACKLSSDGLRRLVHPTEPLEL